MSSLSQVFQEGSFVLVVDPKDRRLLLRLEAGASANTHRGLLTHDSIIGVTSGSTVLTRSGSTFVVYAPSFTDIVLEMPRGAQIIYPKDIAAMLGELSLQPGLRILEAGFGSGALTMGLLRYGAKVVTVEKREDFANRGRKNVESFLPPELSSNLTVVHGDVLEVALDGVFDRVVLDLLDPWTVIPRVRPLLSNDGRVVIYVTNINQVQEVVRAVRSNALIVDSVKEILERSWIVNGDVVRPEQKMVGHTGFIISAKTTQPSVAKPRDSEGPADDPRVADSSP
ncbi:MAG: tRNA (adenine-N1)-methyltransferase [Ferrimicrobium sp.]|uniref:tRNA (adenine-N1)-methyltransferase n=1 Tax=Ferrimicrobium sp. TaxID=2926050 RepID=UPI00261882AB|nr:tRNA (adenine-N1)-methyltransferase [Ferrimicrobium sp.]